VQFAPPSGCTLGSLPHHLKVPSMLTSQVTLTGSSPLAAIELLERLRGDDHHTPLPRRLPAARIETLPIFNSRSYRDDSAVADLLAAIAQGTSVPPLVVYPAGGRVFLMDGHMRLEAHRQWAASKGREGAFTVPVVDFEGTPTEAVLSSVERNAKHGVKLTTGERTDAAWKLVLIGRGLTRSQIEAATGVSRRTINTMRTVRRDLATAAEQHVAWVEARQAVSRSGDLTVDEMLDLREARAERLADQIARAVGARHSEDPDLMATAMYHFMGRKRAAFAGAVADRFRGEIEEGQTREEGAEF